MRSLNEALATDARESGALPLRYRIAHAAFEMFCRAVFAFFCPLTTRGREHLPQTPFLLCANHGSHMDTPALMTAAGGSYDNYAMIAARDYFFSGDSPNKFKYHKFMFLIPVDRRASRDSLRGMFAECGPHLKSGRNLIIYPEGTRSKDGSIGAMKRGAAVLALGLNLPVVPAHINGTFRRLPKGAMFPRPGAVSVRFGKALMPADYKDDKNASRLLINDIAESVKNLAGENTNP